jgi:hypothetical protein
MALQDIVNMTITLKSSSPTKAGFGRALIAGYHTKFLGRTKLYKTPDEMLADGFTTNDQLYKLANALKSQTPAPKDFKIGRFALPPTQIINLIPTITTQGFIYSGKINGIPFSYTVLAAATVATISTALASLIGGLGAGVTASGASTTWCACTATTAGKILQYTELVPELQVKDATVDPGVATDLSAIFAADTDWFGLLLASNSENEVNAASAWVESRRRLFKFTTADFGAKDAPTTTDVLSDVKAVNAFNTEGSYHHEVGSMLAAASMGAELVMTPGTYTLAHKAFRGVETTGVHANGTPYLTTTQEAAVWAKNGNTYTNVAGNGDYFPAKIGGGDFVDAVRFIHFMFARLQERVIGTLQGAQVIRFTRAGIAVMQTAILSLLLVWTKKPYEALSLEKGFEPTCEFPDLADIDDSDRQARHLPDGTFSARYTGAIHTIDISGTVSV